MTDATGSSKELVRERHEHDKTAVQAKLDDLKTKLHHGRQTATDDADRAPATTRSSG